jgi:DNA-binding CsgD family transcriptional regulator
VEPVLDLGLLEQGRAALARGAWEDALAALTSAVGEDPTNAQAWEALAYARTWLQRTPDDVEARQRAYALYREQADDFSAARVALDLVYDFIEVRAEPAVANGWMQRARRLLEGRELAAEHAVLRIWDAYMVLDDDPAVAAEHAREAAEIASGVRAADVGVLALAVHGLACVSEGRVAEGMRLLDEAVAAATGREITDPQWYYFACCCMIDACDRVRDFSRSFAWCEQLREFAERWRVQAFLTTCRVKYTAALLWRGEWRAYEEQLEQAISEMTATRPAGVAGAAVRLAELRRRQGRRDDAEALLGNASAHPLGLQVRAAIALDRGDSDSALDLLDAGLRRATASARTERLAALELKARAHAARSEVDRATEVAAELASIAERIGTDPLRASALVASGLALAAARDLEKARRHFEDAAFLLEKSGSRYEAARARLDSARCLGELGRAAAARAEASSVLATFESLGAEVEAAKARALLDRHEAEPGVRTTARTARLTPRQREILMLVSQGMADREIATRLFLSEHTVHRHIANVLARLEVASRTAAVAKAIRMDLL